MKDATSRPLLDPDFLRKLERLAIAAKRVQLGLSKGERRSKRKGSSVEFADYRDYVQGDDLRFVDWNIYGRLDALYLKLFREQEDLTVHLLIDASRSMSFGTPPKIEFACKLAAAIGYIALIGYDRVCLEAFSGADEHRMRPCRGRASVTKMFSFIESLEGEGGTHLERACRSYVLRNRAKGAAVIISDFFDQDGFEGCLRRLTMSSSDVYAIHVMAPEEIKPQLSGDLKLLDSETNSFVEISASRALLKRYTENRDGFCEAIRTFCVARGIGHFVVSSDTPVEEITLDMLRKGGLLR
jgi:uncharacterized protein (DUF58 family)